MSHRPHDRFVAQQHFDDFFDSLDLDNFAGIGLERDVTETIH